MRVHPGEALRDVFAGEHGVGIAEDLQLALDRRGIRSDVFNPGTSPAGCEARLVYNASVDYGRRSFSDEATQYLSMIDLTLIQDGRILVTARYQTGGLGVDRFSSASTKLDGLIGRMVVDRLDLPSGTLQTSDIGVSDTVMERPM